MPMNDRTPVTRRSALSASLTALLAAGTASMLPGTTSAAPEPISAQHDPLVLATVVVDPAALADECKRLAAESHRTLLVAADLSHFGHGEAAEAYEEALYAHLTASQEWLVAELQRHFPGLAPAIAAVWAHILDETGHFGAECCERGAE